MSAIEGQVQINTALAELQSSLPRITKELTAKVKSERTGAQYSYNYADLAQISAEVLPRLGKLGLSFVARPTLVEGKFVLAYELRHTSGEFIAGVYPLPERGATPQEVGGAITYARRYCLCAITGVAPEDDDNDAIVAEKAAKRRAAREPRQSQQADGKEPPITADQLRRMQKAFRDLGLIEREDKLRYATEIVSRPLSSATELTQIEAGKVIKQAEQHVAAKSANTQEWPPTAQPPEGGAVDVS